MASKPSKLSQQQWEEIKRRHIVDKVPIRQLAREYGIGEKTIRDYLKKPAKKQSGTHSPANPAGAKERIEKAAIVATEAARSAGIEPEEVGIALSLAAQLESVRSRLNEVARNHLDVAVMLSQASKRGMPQVIREDGSVDLENLKQLAVMIETTNRATYVGVEVAKQQKDVKPENPEKGEGPVRFYIPNNGRN